MKQKRPFWVWAVFLFTLFGVVFSIFSIYLVESGSVAMDETKRNYFDSLGVIDWGLAFVGTALSLASGVSLFLLKKISVDLFLAGVVFMVVNYAYSAVATTYLETLDTPTMFGMILGFSVSVIMYLYAKTLREKGILA